MRSEGWVEKTNNLRATTDPKLRAWYATRTPAEDIVSGVLSADAPRFVDSLGSLGQHGESSNLGGEDLQATLELLAAKSSS